MIRRCMFLPTAWSSGMENFFIGNELISGMEPPAGCLQAASALANTYSTSKQYLTKSVLAVLQTLLVDCVEIMHSWLVVAMVLVG
jgi:hypothetical protein